MFAAVDTCTKAPPTTQLRADWEPDVNKPAPMFFCGRGHSPLCINTFAPKGLSIEKRKAPCFSRRASSAGPGRSGRKKRENRDRSSSGRTIHKNRPSGFRSQESSCRLLGTAAFFFRRSASAPPSEPKKRLLQQPPTLAGSLRPQKLPARGPKPAETGPRSKFRQHLFQTAPQLPSLHDIKNPATEPTIAPPHSPLPKPAPGGGLAQSLMGRAFAFNLANWNRRGRRTGGGRVLCRRKR